MQFRMALLNVTRQRRRSAFGIGSVAFGVIALLLAGGFIEWIFWAMREGTIQSRLGHIQIVRDGYFKYGAADPFKYLLPPDEQIQADIRRLPGTLTATPRLAFSGLISAGEATLSFLGEGMEPAGEQVFAKAVQLSSGKLLAEDDGAGIMVGQGLAATLKVKVGDAVTLLTTVPGGGVSGADATVRGIFATASKAYDDVAIRIPLKLAHQLTRTKQNHSIVVLLSDTNNTATTAAALRTTLAGRGMQVVPWSDLADFYRKTVDLFSKQVSFMKLIIAAIIVMSILNTMMSTVMERTGEIGTSMALGVRRAAILRQFIIEGLVIGAIGGAIGLAIGWLLAVVISAIGIPMPAPPGMSQGFTGAIRVTGGLAADAALLSLGTALLASLYPAWKASRLEVVDALRHNR